MTPAPLEIVAILPSLERESVVFVKTPDAGEALRVALDQHGRTDVIVAVGSPDDMKRMSRAELAALIERAP